MVGGGEQETKSISTFLLLFETENNVVYLGALKTTPRERCVFVKKNACNLELAILFRVKGIQTRPKINLINFNKIKYNTYYQTS